MVRSSEIDDCTMLFLCSLLLGRGRGIIFKPSRSGYPFFYTSVYHTTKKRRSKNLLSVIRLGLLVFCVFQTAQTLGFRRKVCEYQRVLFSSENYRLGSIRTRSKNKCNASVTHFLIAHTELLYRHALWDGKLSIYFSFL